MQFTGLVDKNKKEIYEKDIVKVDDVLYTIIWVEGYAKFDLVSKEIFYFKFLIRDGKVFLGDTSFEIEVVGNAFQHPHLLCK